jgi:Dolichyl-phosphate-mannose-protein mannosyltransferase
MPAVWARWPRRGDGSSALKLGISVFLIALALRLLFGRLIADTYDYDEFVLLLLARDFAHGDVPYRDFMFFHPPGALVMLRGLEPLTALWWPAARIATSVLDAFTATLVFAIGRHVFNERAGFAAGLVYAASPLALVSSVRVGQDPLITAFGTLSVALLVLRPGRRWAAAAGLCLGLAVWTKYPAAYFVPICLLVSPRRWPYLLLGSVCALLALLLPFVGEAHTLYSQTITFQHTRWTMALDQRLYTTLVFWLGLNVFALPALRHRMPAWLVAGFALGGLFFFNSQVYYHYFVLVVPFAALLAGRTLADVPAWRAPLATTAMLLAVCLTAFIIDVGGHSPLYVTAARLSEVEPTVQLLDTVSSGREPVLADRYEYAYLAQRPALAHYFWNIGVLVNAGYLEQRVHSARAVVLSSGASSGYPAGFIRYLNHRYHDETRPTTTVWIVPRTVLRQ